MSVRQVISGKSNKVINDKLNKKYLYHDRYILSDRKVES